MTEALQTLSNSMADVVEQAGAGIVRVSARRRLAATGVIWPHESGPVIVTAHHVVEIDDNIEIGLPDGSTTTATLVGRDPSTDLAVLRLDQNEALGDSAPVQTVEADDLRVGHLVLALGRPDRSAQPEDEEQPAEERRGRGRHGRGRRGRGQQGSASWGGRGRSVQATLGIVSALGDEWRTPGGGEIDSYLQTDVVMYPGFSGGPLVTADGSVAGINTSALVRGVSLTVPTATINRVVNDLMSHGRVSRGYLGIGVQPLRLAEPLQQQAEQEIGLMVMSVESDSPAATAGLVQGDVLIALDGESVQHVDTLQQLLGGNRVGREVSARVVRGGQVQEMNVTIGQQG